MSVLQPHLSYNVFRQQLKPAVR